MIMIDNTTDKADALTLLYLSKQDIEDLSIIEFLAKYKETRMEIDKHLNHDYPAKEIPTGWQYDV